MAHHLSYLLLSPAAIHLAFWPPDCGRFHPLHPLFAPNRVAQADHGMPENPKQHFCVPEECVEGVGTSPSTSKISPAPPTTSPSETAYDTALRSCLRRAGVPSLYPHQRDALTRLSSGGRIFQNVQTGGGKTLVPMLWSLLRRHYPKLHNRSRIVLGFSPTVALLLDMVRRFTAAPPLPHLCELHDLLRLVLGQQPLPLPGEHPAAHLLVGVVRIFVPAVLAAVEPLPLLTVVPTRLVFR